METPHFDNFLPVPEKQGKGKKNRGDDKKLSIGRFSFRSKEDVVEPEHEPWHIPLGVVSETKPESKLSTWAKGKTEISFPWVTEASADRPQHSIVTPEYNPQIVKPITESSIPPSLQEQENVASETDSNILRIDHQPEGAAVNTEALPQDRADVAPVSETALKQPEDRFAEWMRNAGFDESFIQSNDQLAEQQVMPVVESSTQTETVPQPLAENGPTDGTESVNRYQARHNSLLAFAAGLLIGNRFGKNRIKRELQRTNAKLERLEVNKMRELQNHPSSREAYNRQYWNKSQAGEQSPENVYNDDEGMEDLTENLKPNTRIERDAWHSIVVDNHNHEDMSARQFYGKEFEREQRELQHQIPADQQAVAASDDMTSDDSTQPGVTTGLSNVLGKLPSGITEPELGTGQSSRADPQHLLAAVGKRSTSFLASPWLWLLVGLLILTYFIASLFG